MRCNIVSCCFKVFQIVGVDLGILVLKISLICFLLSVY